MSEAHQRQTSRSVLRNVIYGAFTWFVPVLLSFVATPVIVHSLGDHDYGIYALVIGVIGYSFAFALGRAITKYIAEYRAAGKTDKIREIISATFFLNVAVGVIGVLTLCGLAGWLVRDIFNIAADDQQKTVSALYIAAGVIFFSMIGQVFSAVVQGMQRFDVYSKIFTSSNIALISGNLVLAWRGFGLVALLWWNLGVLFVGCIAYATAARKLLPEFGISFKLDRETMRLVWRYSLAIILYQVLANALLLFERGWITHQMGSENLTYYVVPMSLGIMLFGFISSLVLVIFPLASELSGDRERLLRLYTKATKVICVLVVFIVATAIVLSGRFLTLWMGPAFAERSSELLVIHMICFGAISIMTVAFQTTEGLGHPGFNAGLTAITTIVGIALMIALTPSLGNTGVALARLAGFLAVFGSIFVVEKRFFKHVQTRFWARLLGGLVLATAATVLIEYGLSMVTPVAWYSLVLAAACGGVAYAFVLWLLDFVTADEKVLIRAALSR